MEIPNASTEDFLFVGLRKKLNSVTHLDFFKQILDMYKQIKHFFFMVKMNNGLFIWQTKNKNKNKSKNKLNIFQIINSLWKGHNNRFEAKQ